MLSFFLLFILILSVLLSCTSNKVPRTDAVSTVHEEISIEPEKMYLEPDDFVQTTVLSEQYLPNSVKTQLVGYLKNASDVVVIPSSDYPVACQDIVSVSGLSLNKISLPVFEVGNTDGNGDFELTVFVFDNSAEGLTKTPKRTYLLKINAQAAGITPNTTVRRYIDVDVTDLGIVLTKNETLAYGSETDTVKLAKISGSLKGEASIAIGKSFAQGSGLFSKIGTSSLAGPSVATMMIDYSWNKTYTNSEVFLKDKMSDIITQLKERYHGKYLSVLGDSISTFGEFSNNGADNQTISGNSVHYTKNKYAGVRTWNNTYWGNVIDKLGMKRCVINAWGGSQVVGQSAQNYKDATPVRANELDNDNGTPIDESDDIKPDVILFFMGINDLQRGASFGSLYDLLSSKVDASWNEQKGIIDTWFASQKSKSVGSDFEQNYALAIYRMKQKYPNAEIYCMTLMQTRDSRYNPTTATKYNKMIEILCQYFDVICVDWATYGPMKTGYCHAYGVDSQPAMNSTHVNGNGFLKMAEWILYTMYLNQNILVD